MKKFRVVISYLCEFPQFGLCEFRAYDRAAIKFRGVDADINFSIADYEEDMKQVGLGYFLFYPVEMNFFSDH